jgi:hypothetical protein
MPRIITPQGFYQPPSLSRGALGQVFPFSRQKKCVFAGVRSTFVELSDFVFSDNAVSFFQSRFF